MKGNRLQANDQRNPVICLMAMFPERRVLNHLNEFLIELLLQDWMDFRNVATWLCLFE